MLSYAKPHHSFAVIVDEIEREMVTDYLKNNLQNYIFVNIENSFKQSLIKALKENNIKHSKSANIIYLADKLAKYARENEKHIIINFKEFITLRNQDIIPKALVAIYNTLTQNPSYYDIYTYYPVLITSLNTYKNLAKEEGMWRYKPHFPKDFNVEVGLWIEKIKCWKCNSDIDVLVGLKVNNHYFNINDLKEEFLEFLKEYFPNEASQLNLKKDTKGLLGYISNICPVCNSKIGNHYIYDEYFVEQMPFNFENVEIKSKKIIPYDEVKKVLDLTFK